MVNPQVILKKCILLQEYIDFLKSMHGVSWEAFEVDKRNHGSVERYLQLSIELVLDMGSHIISDEKLGEIQWSRDIPLILFSQGRIDESTKIEWIQMIGFRNILVHEYATIDKTRVFQVLKEKIGFLEYLLNYFKSLK